MTVEVVRARVTERLGGLTTEGKLAWLKHFAEDMGMPEAFAVPSERARPAAEPVQEPLGR